MKFRDVGRLIRCIGCAGAPKAGLRAVEKSTFVVQDMEIVAVVVEDMLSLTRTEIARMSTLRLLVGLGGGVVVGSADEFESVC